MTRKARIRRVAATGRAGPRRLRFAGGLVPMVAALALALSACQSAGPVLDAARWHVEPVVQSGSAALSAPQLYQLGRYYQGQLRDGPAAAAFMRALQLDPGYVEAYNALGALYCERGRVDDGIGAFQQALRLSPSASHLQSNLGYALILAGRHAEAASVLQRAVELDPGNAKAWANLSLALAVVGTVEQADIARQQAAQRVPPPAESDRPAAGNANVSIVVGADVADGAKAVRLAEGVYELRSWTVAVAQAPIAASMPVSDPGIGITDAASTRSSFRLEIANGNGMTGAARRVGQWLAQGGTPVARLSNERPYNRLNTVIYFNRGFEDEARRLQQALGVGSGALVAEAYSRADVRVAVGRDLLPVLVARREARRVPDPMTG
jgi:tetratricopeptide (TPR) repeat protein